MGAGARLHLGSLHRLAGHVVDHPPGSAVNAAELAQAMLSAKRDIDQAMMLYEQRIREDAEADDKARRAKARAYLTCREQAVKSTSRPTVQHIEAMVDLETADAQTAGRLSEGTKRAAGMAVEGARQWLSALQSLASLTKAEAQLAAWQPRETMDDPGPPVHELRRR